MWNTEVNAVIDAEDVRPKCRDALSGFLDQDQEVRFRSSLGSSVVPGPSPSRPSQLGRLEREFFYPPIASSDWNVLIISLGTRGTPQGKNPTVVKAGVAPEFVNIDNWLTLVNYCNSAAFQALSEQNSVNRKKLKAPTFVGRNSMAVIRHKIIRQCERLDPKPKTTSMDDYVAKNTDISVTKQLICNIRGVSNNLTIEVEGVKYLLRKFPLLSKCLRLQKLHSQSSNFLQQQIVQLFEFPGGVEAFETCGKFCYGISITLSALNITAVRCAAEYIQMTKDIEKGNLIFKLVIFLNSCHLRSGRTLYRLFKAQNLYLFGIKISKSQDDLLIMLLQVL
ncbi:hypothetical protein GIB67_029514 [Kingdonia uniflora]|uniref:Uncharacterized protein n=1 Tax=Kingdonia uniflora TaxID=39325 RepID=A0A7J7NY17_9MAGN|nr:hypothetical protein GIB67_029514 [Kingdonia uniflora]